MRLVLPCCWLQSPCGTWHASFSIAAPCAAPSVKNNSMRKCFAVFWRVTEFAPPMSRRLVTYRRELLLPLRIPDRHPRAVVLDPSVPTSAVAAIDGNSGNRRELGLAIARHRQAAKQTSQTTAVAIPELLAGSHLLTRLIFRRIRPQTHSAMIGGPSCSPDEPQPARAPIAPLDIAAPLIECAEARVSAPVPSAIETLFTQLARRRLRNRAAEETR